MNVQKLSLLSSAAVLALMVGSAQAVTITTVGVYDEDTVNANTVDAVSATTNNSLTLSDTKTALADAFAANTGGVWDMSFVAGAFDGNYTSYELSYGVSQSNTLTLTSTDHDDGDFISGYNASSTTTSGISTGGFMGKTSGGNSGLSGDLVWTPSTALTLISITTLDRDDAARQSRLTATLQDNTVIFTASAGADTDTLQVLTATVDNPIVSFTFEQTAGSFSRYDDLGFIVVPEPGSLALLGLGGLLIGTRRRRG